MIPVPLLEIIRRYDISEPPLVVGQRFNCGLGVIGNDEHAPSMVQGTILEMNWKNREWFMRMNTAKKSKLVGVPVQIQTDAGVGASLIQASKIYIHDARIHQTDPLIVKFDQDSLIIPLDDAFRHTQTDDAWCVEQYAGGFGGWTHAHRFLQTYTMTRRRTIAIESHMPYATQFALSHGFDFISHHDTLPAHFAQSNARDVIFHAKIQSRTWQQQLQSLYPEMWLISAPCKSWSGAGRSQGFQSEDGLSLAESIAQTRIFRPKIVALEQVKGFRDHHHYPIACRLFEWAGFTPIIQCSLDLVDLTPVKRNRWLALYIRTEDAQNFHAFQPQAWPSIPATVSTFDASQDLPAAELVQFQPTKDQAAMYFDAQYMPGQKRQWSKTEIREHRVPRTNVKLPTFMAAYGEQHMIDKNLLSMNGLMGFFRRQANTIRFWTPAEITMLHAVVHPVLILKPAPIGWQTIGNSIAPLHALYIMFHAYRLLEDFHEPLSFEKLVNEFLDNRLQVSSATVLQDECAWYLGLPSESKQLQKRLEFFMAQLCWKTHAQNKWPDNQFFSPISGLRNLNDAALECTDGTKQLISPTLPIHIAFDMMPFLIPGEYGQIKVDGQTTWRALLELWDYRIKPTGFNFDWDLIDRTIVDTMPVCKAFLVSVPNHMDVLLQLPSNHNEIPTVPILLRESTNLALYEVEKKHHSETIETESTAAKHQIL